MLAACEILLQALSLITLRGALTASQASALDDAVYAYNVLCNATGA